MAKETDVVLVYIEEQPMVFARIEEISPDSKRDWYHVKLLLLQVPLQVVTWILRDVYINGETFTMGGRRMRLERVVCPADPDPEKSETTGPAGRENTSKVVSIHDLKKKK